MSRAYIVTRNGGTVTKAPINDNKIPIYANETALDADLSNLPDGTICATSSGHDDVIDQMKDYIRKQNDLSDWEATSVGTTSATAFEAQYDGFLLLTATDVNLFRIYVNEVDVARLGCLTNCPNSTTIPLKKGDKVYVTGQLGLLCYVAYYKNRDYTGR